MNKTDFPRRETLAIRALDLAELKAISGGEGCVVSIDPNEITNREFIEKNFGVKWPIPD